ncbi:hypothetical protein [Polaribacter ponticola]|uniref:Uncharacterized protein n=1 Tax=Polaribacter ponticola TaxID=2978475 RepID=A0ABT5S4C1_9FLAO|nr:hypothetical protein [Polaribacter sp. MSW5]MDD7912956.1 hypothetical protein [Polaribacter sp. MSW5]MDD7913746.1 hypothetical protein [Polaribacter sp. MSW5]
MPTLTAMQPRPYIFPRAIAKVELVQALPEDLQVYDPVWGKYILRIGLIYWHRSEVSGKLEGTPFVITKDTDVTELKNMLDRQMIWISKNAFN